MRQHPTTLLALLKRPRDEQRLLDAMTYHLPLGQASYVHGTTEIAFYVGGWHPQSPCCVRYHATIVDAVITTRAAYIVDEPNHPRATDRYLVLTVSDLTTCDPLIASERWRRISLHRINTEALHRTPELGQIQRTARRMPPSTDTWEW
jgi:hypothetical protein